MNLKSKKTVAVLALIATTSIGGSAFAASKYSSPAEMTAGVTNQSVESVMEQKKNGNKTYSEIAEEAGKLEEYKAEKLQMKKDKLDKLVKEEKITQEEADEKLEKSKEHIEKCDGKERKTNGGRCREITKEQ